MKPNFALSLSFEGIRLLHRAAGGWRRVGEVPVTSEDLPSALSDLRAAAAVLDDGPLRTKLIIPDDQIKYLSVETPGADPDARHDAARAALDGATPYAVDALVFDICADGDTTHVAAVARETLAEAEAFASEHQFHPVCFVAAPDDQPFMGEPWFGTAAHARALLAPGEEVEADGVRVVIIGDAETETAQTDDAAPVAAPEPVAAEESDAPDTTPLAVEDVAAKPVVEDAAGEPVVEDPAPEPVVEDPAPKRLTEDTAPAPDTPPAPRFTPVDDGKDVEDEGDQASPAPALGFASRRAATAPPTPISLGGVTRSASPDATTPPSFSARAPEAAPLTPPPAAAISLRAAPEVAEAPAPKAPRGGFLSRRKAVQPAPASATAQAEAQRMTIFGARDPGQIGGKPRYLGLILTAILLVFMAGVAALASVYLDDRIASWFQRDRTLASTVPDDALADDVGATTALSDDAPGDDGVAVASLNEDLADGLSEEDAAVLDALRDPLPAPQAPEELDAAALEARYAVTGIWPKAPDLPDAPPLIPLEDFYLTSIDPVSPALDAVALPRGETFQTDDQLPDVSNPAAPGTNFARDDNGFIIPTPDGTLSPDGYTVFLGAPPQKPPQTPDRSAEDPAIVDRQSLLAAVRPQARPGDLVEQNERATLGGLLRSELATYRPQLRPPAPQELIPEAVPEEETEEAPVVAALPPVDPVLRPQTRPRNFNRIVTRTQRQQQQNRGSTVDTNTRVASVAPRTVTPAIPSSASATREATVRNAINLRRVNLIGVYGTPSDRRALVRLGNGRYQKVQVGDRFDGGRVSAIGDSELRYVKGGRNVVLKMPSG